MGSMGKLVRSPLLLPRDAWLWDQQLASDQENYAALDKLMHHRHRGKEWDQWVIHESVDLTQVGNTNILRARLGQNGHWHLNGGAISLSEFFAKFAEEYTVAELMFWYYNAPKVFRKRQHSLGSPDVRAAGKQRMFTYGNPGHRE